MKDCTVYLPMSSHELAANESFQGFVFRKNEADILFWERFVNLYPEKRDDVDQAVYILSLFSFKRKLTPGQVKELELNRLLYSVSLSSVQQQTSWFGPVEKAARRKHSFFVVPLQQRRYSVAASLVLGICLLLLSTLFTGRLLGEEKVVLRTTYGENATFLLPDSTVVILNGNTRLTHSADWSNESSREVWLDGEAFFEVKHRGQSAKDRFTVHTPGMDVEVLGTKFNVFNRNHKSSVVLNSGKVKVKLSAQDTSSVLMEPDESLEYSRRDHSVAKRHVNAEALTSWRRKLLVFENTPLREIGEMIEHTYGVDVIFSPDVDKDEKLAGTIPNESLDVLLSVLSKSSNLKIITNNDEILIKRNIRESEEP